MPNSSTVCVDAGCVVRYVGDVTDAEIRRLWQRWLTERVPLVAPLLIRYEVTNALHRYHLHGTRSAAVVRSALASMLVFPIHLHDQPDLHDRAFEFAGRFNIPAAYDAHYLALADRLGAEFWTTDRRLANKVRPSLSWVRLVGE